MLLTKATKLATPNFKYIVVLCTIALCCLGSITVTQAQDNAKGNEGTANLK